MSELAKKPFRFGAEYGFGDTPQPQGQPGFYSVPLPVARQLPQDRPVSFGELTKAYFDIHTLSGSVVEWGTAKAAILAQDSDPGYNPYEDPQLETFTDEEKDSVFYRSRSAGETAIIIERLRREREARRIIETEGLTMRSVGAAVLSNIPDIAAVIVSGGGAAVARGGLTVAQIGARGAAVAAGATAVEEGVLQATQYERTLTESAVNVAGATVFGGLVAAATPAVRKVFGAHQETLIAGMADDAAGILGKKGEFDDQALQIVMNPATGAITEAPYKSVKSATGGPIGWIRKRVSPNGRVDTYPEPVAREMRKYLSTDAISEANLAGEAIVSAEARLYDWDYLTKGAVKSVSDSYKAYLKRERATVAERIKVGLGMPPSRRIMSETEHAAYISRIAQDGADDLIPERFGYTPHPDDLAAGRKVRELLDRYLAEGQKAGVFGADMQPGQYFTHWWKVREIMDRQVDFRNDLIADLPAMLRKQDVTLSPAEIGELASDIIESMTVLKGSLPDGVRVNVGPLKGRTLNFDNQANVVRKWTVQDPYEVLERYKFGVGGRIELARLSGATPDMPEAARKEAVQRAISGEQSKDTIRAYYRTARDGAGSNAEKAALTAQENTALSDVDSMVALLTGGFGDPKDTSGISRLVPAAMKWNYATKMGRVVIAQFNDVGTLPLRYGFGPTIRGFRDAGKYLKDPAWQTAREELRLFADALDTVTATRMMSLADMDNAYLYRTGLDHLTDRLARGTGIVSGFNWWSENFKMMSGQLASGQIFRAATGKPDQFTRGLMAASGLDDAALKELARRPWLERGSSAIPDFGRWPDDDITLAFGRAVRTLVKATTNEPTIGMKPFWTRTTFGKMASQFKGFYFGFFEHTLNFMEQKLVLGTPAEKAGVAGSTAAFMALGALSYWTREKSYGRDPDIDSVDFWFNSMDYSGLPILFTEPNNLLEKLSGGKVGLRPWLGIEPGGRYREIDPVGALAGPTAQLGRDIGGAATAIPVTTFGAIGGSILGGGRGALAGAAAGAVVDITRGEVPSADAVKRFIKITPWNNAVLFSGLYDAADLAGEIVTGSEFLPNEPRKEIPEMIGRSRKRRKGGSL